MSEYTTAEKFAGLLMTELDNWSLFNGVGADILVKIKAALIKIIESPEVCWGPLTN